MTARTPLYYDSTTNRHTPIPVGDTVDPKVLALSAGQGNQLEVRTDGLFVGQTAQTPVIYVAPTGTDVPTSGTSVTPYKTLDYALQQLASKSPSGALDRDTTILLKANTNLGLTKRYTAAASLIFAWYGDPTYGDYPGDLVNNTKPEVIAQLQRPAINLNALPLGTQIGSSGFTLAPRGAIHLKGVKVNLPAVPSPAPALTAYASTSDFITSPNDVAGTVTLNGAIINMPDPSGAWGFLGIHARSSGTTVAQYASQFQIAGTIVDSKAPPSAQSARQWFIKFYADYIGNNQQQLNLAPTSQNSSPGSGLINLVWTDVTSQIVNATASNQQNWPKLADATFGLQNYIWGLVRDIQQRPLNVLSSRLF